VKARPRLLFVSTRFLFPADSGGRIRTAEILRNMKGGRFEIVLACPAHESQLREHGAAVAAVADRLVHWFPRQTGNLARMRYLLSELPIPVATDRSDAGQQAIAREIATHPPDVVVFDFPHAAVLAPGQLPCPAVMFTHNVEAEIFARHASVARDPLRRWIWRDQHRKMASFERQALQRFDRVIAVSERDRTELVKGYSLGRVSVIPTGVSLDYFTFAPPRGDARAVFVGSMDWLANVDGVEFFMDEVWPLIVKSVPRAELTVVGRAPPAHLIERARARGFAWNFTGRVDDVRPHVQGAAASIIPLRVGGGTRIKAFEAMAMGVPVVSTTIGVEGLEIDPNEHFLLADSAADFAKALVRLLTEPGLGASLAQRARRHVEANFSNTAVARRFEEICAQGIEDWRTRTSSAPTDKVVVLHRKVS
jgi:polysaccharide biosynthesis protein PslH